MNKLSWVIILPIILPLVGCNMVGPKTIGGASFNYNEAIARSRDQQMLLNLVRLRYRDTPFFLEVGSVTTQYSMVYSAGVSPRLFSGDTDSVTRTLMGSVGGITNTLTQVNTDTDQESVDFDLGISYFERPTVTYTPLQGGEFVKQMLSPIPITSVAMLSDSGWSVARVLRLCLQEMNGLDNASRASGPTPVDAPPYKDFVQATTRLRELQIDGALDFTTGKSEDGIRVTLRINPSAQDLPEVKELKELLKLDPEPNEFIINQQPFFERSDQLTVRTRSLLGVMYFLSQGVTPPVRHEEEHRVTVTRNADGSYFDWKEITGDLLQIKSQDSYPWDAFVKVRYRGTWFYIDDSDLNSKTTFGLLSYLFYLQAGGIESIGPVTTLSIGG